MLGNVLGSLLAEPAAAASPDQPASDGCDDEGCAIPRD
jgi:hypothetical protein